LVLEWDNQTIADSGDLNLKFSLVFAALSEADRADDRHGVTRFPPQFRDDQHESDLYLSRDQSRHPMRLGSRRPYPAPSFIS